MTSMLWYHKQRHESRAMPSELEEHECHRKSLVGENGLPTRYYPQWAECGQVEGLSSYRSALDGSVWSTESEPSVSLSESHSGCSVGPAPGLHCPISPAGPAHGGAMAPHSACGPLSSSYKLHFVSGTFYGAASDEENEIQVLDGVISGNDIAWRELRWPCGECGRSKPRVAEVRGTLMESRDGTEAIVRTVTCAGEALDSSISLKQMFGSFKA